MALHLIKLCVGADSVDDLADWLASGRADWKAPGGGARAVAHITRQVPTRSKELLDGGSLYWVIGGRIQVRQRLVAIEATTDQQGARRCALVMEPSLILTRPRPHRPFQGWRYLEPSRAPSDLGRHEPHLAEDATSLKAELAALGLI
jgi:hypothetical protein